MITINSWYGRLGNNIIQLYNCICVSLELNCDFIYPKHDFFNKKENITSLLNTKYNYVGRNVICPITNFFNENEIIKNNNFIDHKIFDKHKAQATKIIKDIFIIKQKNVFQYDIEDLHIHIRSGDIFKTNPHPNYIPPPLCYYTNIINNNNFKNIYLICEDKLNPVVEQLLKMYPKIIFKIQDLKSNIEMILGSKNIVSSVGSFINALLLINNDAKHFEFNINNYPTYKKLMCPWVNNDTQRKIILDYKN